MRKLCFIGAGWFANEMHGPALAHYVKEHPGEVQLAGLCVRRNVERAEAFCKAFGFRRVYTDLDEMLEAEKPDVCWAVVPIEATRRIAGHLLERGIATFFEKPPGANLQEARELAEISQRTGVPNLVAFNRQWAPGTRQLLSWAKDCGPFEYLHARMLRPNRMDAQFAYGTGIHLLDCVLLLGGQLLGGLRSAKTTRVRSRLDESAEPRDAGFEGVFDFHVELRFGCGARGRCEILPVCGMLEESYTLFGAKEAMTHCLPWRAGELRLEGRGQLWRNGELVEERPYPNEPQFRSVGVYGEAEEFLSALREGRKPSPAAEDCVDSVALADAVQAGREIDFRTPPG
jgi:predicted dehydrogenase